MARDLTFRITVDNDGAITALHQTENAISDTEKAADKSGKTADKSAKMFRDLGKAIGAAFSLKSLADMSSKVTKTADNFTNLASKMGISVSAVQELGFAAQQSGGTIEQIGGALALMGQRLTEGGKGTVGALEALGLSLDSIRTMKPDEAFTAIATAISQVEDPMKRSNLAMELFGRSGADLLPLLTANIAELRETARTSGAVISDELIAKGAALDDSWAAMQARVESVRAQAMLPLLETFLNLPAPVQNVIGLVNEFSGVLSGIALAVMSAGGPVVVFGALKGILIAVGTAIAGLSAPVLAIGAAIVGLGLIFYNFGDDIWEAVTGVYTAVKTWLWDKLEPVLTPLIALVKSVGEMFQAFMALVIAIGVKVVGAVAEMVKGIILWIWDKLKPVLDPVIALVKAVGTVFVELWHVAVDAMKNLYEGVKTWLLDKFTGIVDGIKGKIDAVTGFFKDMYEKVVGGSYIPDMVTQIGEHIQRLQPLMVQPVDAATKQATSSFQVMLTSINNQFTEWGNSLHGWIADKVPGILGEGLGAVAGGILNGVMGIFTGGLNKLVQMGVDLAWKGLKKLGSMIAGLFKGEGAKTNDLRDEWMSGLGGLEGAHSLIAGFGNDFTLFNAFEQAYRASSRDDFMRWVEVFQRRLAELQGGAAPNPNAPSPGGGGGGELPLPGNPGGMTSIVINNPQFNDRASINELTARIEQTMFGRMTQRGTRFAY